MEGSAWILSVGAAGFLPSPLDWSPGTQSPPGRGEGIQGRVQMGPRDRSLGPLALPDC